MEENKMATVPMKKLFWKMGLPMIVSMVLQALYNVVDSIFITNMGPEGALANQALTLAFPIQILIISLGVGTGIGINALLSKSLGEKENEKVNRIAGNGIFLGICMSIAFLIFGIFGSKWFISLFAGGNSEVIKMGTEYLSICCILAFGGIGFTVYERFLQATGKTSLSAISQIAGAVANIILDYIFIFPCNMGVSGAAWATVIGQIISLGLAMIFHYSKNKEISGNLKYIKPNFGIIKEIYNIGISAIIMQGLLSVMMAGMNAILGSANANPTILVGSFGIYYKIQQIVLNSCFGLSNTIISILSFNYGMKDKKRTDECIKYGILDTFIVTVILVCLFEIFAKPLSSLFGMAGGDTTEIISVCTVALRIASLGYIFMGFSVAVQGVLQAVGYAVKPLIISLLRLVVFVFPLAYMFTLSNDVLNLVWWTFPIAEILTCAISVFILKKSYKARIENMEVEKSGENLIISISRQHGTGGKEIARIVAKNLGLDFYDKEEIKDFAIKNNLAPENFGTEDLYNNYLSLDCNKEAIINQATAIRGIAKKGDCIIVGRGADYILNDNPNLIRIFLYAPLEYRINKIKEMYNDDEKNAKKHIQDSDKSRAKYYELISNQNWGSTQNYELCLNCQIGNEAVIKVICEYVKNRR